MTAHIIALQDHRRWRNRVKGTKTKTQS